jgi:hypothetical protein
MTDQTTAAPVEPRPESATDEVLEYLDDLRESGETNMFGAAAYLEVDFDYSRAEARAALLYWMHTFSERHPRAN